MSRADGDQSWQRLQAVLPSPRYCRQQAQPLRSRRYSAPVLPWPVEIMLEEIQPRDELTYVAIDETTNFTESDYQRLLDRLCSKDNSP